MSAYFREHIPVQICNQFLLLHCKTQNQCKDGRNNKVYEPYKTSPSIEEPVNPNRGVAKKLPIDKNS